MPIRADILTLLADVLAELYPDKGSIDSMVTVAGLKREQIAVHPKAIDTWIALLQEAEIQDRTMAILDHARTQKPAYLPLKAAYQAYDAWRQAESMQGPSPNIPSSPESQSHFLTPLVIASFAMLLILLAVFWRSTNARQGMLKDNLETAEEQLQTMRDRLSTTVSRILAQEAAYEIERSGGSWTTAGLLAVEALARDNQNPQALETSYAILLQHVHMLTEFRHEQTVHALEFSPDGQHIATGNGGGGGWSEGLWGELRISETETGRELWRTRLDGPVKELLYTADGNWIIAWNTTPRKTQITTYEAQTGRRLARIEHPQINALVASPDGQILATASDDGYARVWNPRTREVVTVVFHATPVKAVTLSPDGLWGASASDDGTIIVWEVATGNVIDAMSGAGVVNQLSFSPDKRWLSIVQSAFNGLNVSSWLLETSYSGLIINNGGVTDAVFSSNKRWLAVSDNGGEVGIWNTRPYRSVRSYKVHGPAIVAGFSPDGKLIVITEACQERARIFCSNAVHIQETETNTEIALIEPESPVTIAAISLDNQRIALVHDDGHISIWEVTAGEQPIQYNHGSSILAAGFSGDNQWIIAGGLDGILRGWNTGGNEDRLSWASDNPIRAMAFSSDGRYVAVGGDSAELFIYDLVTDSNTNNIPVDGSVVALSFSPDNRQLVVGTNDPTATSKVNLIRTDTWQNTEDWSFASGVRSLAFSHDSNTLAVGENDGTVSMINVDSGNITKKISLDGGINALVFHPDDSHILSGISTSEGGGELLLADVTDGTIIWREASQAPILSVDVDPGGRWIATVNQSGLLRLFDLAQQKEVAQLEYHDPTRVVHFSSGGDRLLLASGNTIYMLPWWPDVAGEICHRLTRNLSPEEWQQFLPDEPYHKTCPNIP